MVSAPLTAAIAVIAPLSSSLLLVNAFAPSNFASISLPRNHHRTITWTLSAAGKGFGDKPAPKPQKSSSSPPTTANNDITPATSLMESTTTPIEDDPKANTGSQMLRQLRSREAEKRNEELQKLRELREVDRSLQEDPGAAAIPEKVAQRMGKRMLPFVGVPLFGSILTFVAFWYLATYKNMEFQPAVVASSTVFFLVIGLLGITYSVMSASWDPDREGSAFGADEFSTNLGNIKDGLQRTKENALLREKMMGLSEAEIERAIADSDKRKDAAMKRQKEWSE